MVTKQGPPHRLPSAGGVAALVKETDMSDRTCTADGCTKPVRSARALWCVMHYHRWYRHGNAEVVATGSGISTNHGPSRYRLVVREGHALAHSNGRVYEHRAVLYDTIGPGMHPCHWCGRVLDWAAPPRTPDTLQVDHLNGNRIDNRPDNLVASCPRCNVARAAQERADMFRAAGWWSRNDTVAVSGGRAERIVS